MKLAMNGDERINRDKTIQQINHDSHIYIHMFISCDIESAWKETE